MRTTREQAEREVFGPVTDAVPLPPEPSWDQLAEIENDLDFGPGWRGLTPEYAIEHVRWMVAEIKRLRAAALAGTPPTLEGIERAIAVHRRCPCARHFGELVALVRAALRRTPPETPRESEPSGLPPMVETQAPALRASPAQEKSGLRAGGPPEAGPQ